MFSLIFKWIGIVLGGLAALVVILVFALSATGNARMSKQYSIQSDHLSIPADPVSIEQGRLWAQTLCGHCHLEDLAGKPLLNDPQVGYLPSPNLTPGKGSVTQAYRDEDWVRTLRHGVSPDGRPLVAMPSQNYYYMNDKDLGQLIAYLKTLPPVDREMGPQAMSFGGKALLAAGAFGGSILPAEVIDHAGPRPASAAPEAGAQYGAYLARLEGCHDCHGEGLVGGNSPEPGSPFAPNLTKSGPVGHWSRQMFLTTVRTRESIFMPWDSLDALSDQQLEAIYLYLQSLPAKE
jgi:mono/diheme cytochrome c family protein